MPLLASMKYKSFTWPQNPRTYCITFQRLTAVSKIPMGTYSMEDLGRIARVMQGEGEFFGPGAYDTFKQLASVFYEEGPGLLYHPVWMTASAFFIQLELKQEPREDYVAYSFTFVEDGPAQQSMKKLGNAQQSAAVPAEQPSRYHTVVRGDTMWGISQKYGVALAALLQMNPQISNANLIFPGQKVRVQ